MSASLSALLVLALLGAQALALSECPNFFFSENPDILRVRNAFAGTRKYIGGRSGGRIVGGGPTDLDSTLPRYIVRYGGCTGSVVNERWILTAAHCGSGGTVTFFNVATKAWNVFRGVTRTIRHPSYSGVRNDIMLVELSSDAPDSALFVTINRRTNIPRKHSMLQTAGFGTTSEGGPYTGNTLNQVDVPYINNTYCDSRTGGYDEAMMMCAGYVCGGCDACQGDSGGPIYQFTDEGEMFQVGITSFGTGCARPNFPGYYARVSTYKLWIKETLAGAGFWVGGIVPQLKIRKKLCP